MRAARLLLLIEPMQERHARVQREKRIERHARLLVRGGKRNAPAQLDVVGITHGGGEGEAVETPAQDDRQQPRIACAGERRFGQQTPQCQRRRRAAKQPAP
jgi:hypothetical protein